jgi:hypothetical protein
MTIFAFILGFVIATILGALFHILRAGSIRRMGLNILTANISFFLGHLFSELVKWQSLRLGSLNLFPAALAAILGLILTTALTGQELPAQPPSPRSRSRRK